MTTAKNLSETCYLCGKKAENPEKEHFLPQKIMKLTGDLNRKVTIPISIGKTQTIEFAKMYLIVCAKCHDQLNDSIDKPGIATLVQLISHGTVESLSIQTLLNLFDKIRLGFWFYQHIYQTEEGSKDWLHQIWPFFDRIEKFDRGLVIQRLPEKIQTLNVFGTHSPIFQESPNCFSMKINNLLFISYSSPFAFSKFLNLPYPKNISLLKPVYGEIEIIPDNSLYQGQFSNGGKFFDTLHSESTIHLISPKYNGLNPNDPKFKQILSGMASNDPEVFDFILEPKLIIRDQSGFRRLFTEKIDLSKEIEISNKFESKSHILEILNIQKALFSMYDDVDTKLELQNEYIDIINKMDFSR